MSESKEGIKHVFAIGEMTKHLPSASAPLNTNLDSELVSIKDQTAKRMAVDVVIHTMLAFGFHK